jgi:hypothetical protein
MPGPLHQSDGQVGEGWNRGPRAKANGTLEVHGLIQLAGYLLQEPSLFLSERMLPKGHEKVSATVMRRERSIVVFKPARTTG